MWCDGARDWLERRRQPQQPNAPPPRRRQRHGSLRWQLWAPPLLLLLVGRPALGLPVGGTATDCGGGANGGGGSGGDPVYDSVQARAVSAQYVLVGKVQAFVDAAAAGAAAGPAAAAVRPPAAAASSSRLSTGAYVLVESVAKEAPGIGGVQPNAVIVVDGLTSQSVAGRKTPGGVGAAGAIAAAAPPALASAVAGCTTVVKNNANYILFLNASAAGDGRFTVVRAAANYSRSDYTLVRDVTCAGCATRPIAKAKRLEQVEEGTVDYKMACRADSRLMSAVDWYKDGVLVSAGSGVHLSEKKRKDSVTRTLRLRKVRQSDAGVYQCLARNALGNSTAVTKLVVLPRGSPTAGSTTPRSPVVLETVATTVTVATDELSSKSAISHYVDCPTKDMGYCLHGGRCRVRPNGNGRHCVCPAQYSGHRCEEKHVVVGTRPVSDDEDSEGVKSHVITALATALGVLLLAVCLYIFFCASRRWARKRAYAEMQAASAVSTPMMRADGFMPLSEVDGARGKTAVSRYTIIPVTDHVRHATAMCGDLHSRCVQPSSPANQVKRAASAEQGMFNGPRRKSSSSTVAAAAAAVKQPRGKQRHHLLEIFNPKRRQRLAATASSTDSLQHHAVGSGSSPAIRGNATLADIAMKSSSVGQQSALQGFLRFDPTPHACPMRSNAHLTPDVDEPAVGSATRQNAVHRAGSLYEEPGAVDTSSVIHVNREQKATCDTSPGDRASRGSSYDTVDGLTVPRCDEPAVLNGSDALDALLVQLTSDS